MIDHDVDSMLHDWKFLIGAETDRELAEHLSIHPTTIAMWRRRKRIPEKYILKFKVASDRNMLGGMKNNSDRTSLFATYIFALVSFADAVQRDHIRLPLDENDANLYFGARLCKLYNFLKVKFMELHNPDDEALRKEFDERKSQIKGDPLFRWLEAGTS